MLKYTNIQRFDNMPFENYLHLSSAEDKFYSHSFLKSEIAGQAPLFIASAKVKLGAMVDAILTSPDTVDPSKPEFKQACKIASAIKLSFKGILNQFEPQVSFSGQITFKGLVLNTCGRLDWLLPKIAPIDLKVTEAKTDKEFKKIIDFMGYDNQMFNYCGLSETKQAFILPYSTKANACLSVVKMEYSTSANEFWEKSVLKFGK